MEVQVRNRFPCRTRAMANAPLHFQLSDRIASVFLLLPLFGKQIDYLLSV
jgi:hypothetical protein